MVSDRAKSYADGNLLMSLKDLITYALSFPLDEVQKAVITNIRNQYNL